MPIRINLLAEQQSLELQRRNDPAKKALWIGGFLVALMLVWVLSLWFDGRMAANQVKEYQTKWVAQTNLSVQASNSVKAFKDLQGRSKVLNRYSTNRFLWASALDALQYTVVTNIRVTRIVTSQRYVTNAVITKTTNVALAITPPKHWWNFGAGEPPINIYPAVTNAMLSLAALPVLATNGAPLIKSFTLKTNEDKTAVTVSVTVIKPITVVESRVLTISGKDFSLSAGQQISSLTNAILTHPFFGTWLTRANLSVDSSFQLEEDPLDRSQGPFVLFSVLCTFPDTVRSNE